MNNYDTASNLNTYYKVLFPYAYNIVGSSEDAKDAIQDVFSNYITTGPKDVLNEKNYLIRSVINRAITIKNKRRRMSSTEVWLPEPVATESADVNLNLKDILTYSMMVLLERLSARERAVFILKEGFSYSHEEVSEFLSTTTENSRKLLSRAKSRLKYSETRPVKMDVTSKAVLNDFIIAIRSRDMQKLESLLSEDIAFYADGGPNLRVVAKHRSGSDNVAALLLFIHEKYQMDFSIRISEVNHEPSLLFYAGTTLISCQVFDFSLDGKIERINTVIDPEKLGRFSV